MSENNDQSNVLPVQNVPEWSEACTRGECTHKRLRGRGELELERSCAPFAHWKLASTGHRIFPVHAIGERAKQPAFGFAHGKPAPESWYAENQYAGLIGITPGPSGYVVVDLDSGSLDDLRATLGGHGVKGFGVCPSRTEGRYHLWFKRPPGYGGKIGNAQWDLAGCSGEIRADRGYVILWELGVMLDFLLRADSPGKLPVFPVELFLPRKVGEVEKPPLTAQALQKTGAVGLIEKRFEAYIRKPLEEVATAPEGARNNTLNATAYSLFRRIIAHENELPADYLASIRGQLFEAAKIAGESDSKIASTLESALKAARENPVRLEDKPPTGSTKAGTTAPSEEGEVEAESAELKIDLSAFELEQLDTEGSISDVWMELFPNRLWDEERGSWYALGSGGHWEIDATRRIYEEHRAVAMAISQAAEELAIGLFIEADEGGEGIDPKALRAKARALKSTHKTFRRNPTIAGAEIQSRGRRPKLKTWDPDPLHVGIPSGAIELHENGDWTIHSPAPPGWMITKSLAVDPDFENPPQLWLRSLPEWASGDTEVTEYIEQVMGYSLTGLIREQKLFFWFGKTKTGKTVCTETILFCLGDYGTTAATETFLSKRYTEHSTEIARLQGIRFVLTSEIPPGRSWNTQRVKDLTGGSRLIGRFMRQDNFTFDPQFKLVFAGNDMPNLKGKDPALIERLAILPFQRAFSPKERNPDLLEELKQEAGGILARALEGYRKWRQNGRLRPPRPVSASVEAYRVEQDRLAEWLDAECTFEEDEFMSYGAGYDSYKIWCTGEGEKPMGKRQFCKELRESGSGESLREGKKANKKGVYGLFLNTGLFKENQIETNGSPF